MSGEAVVEVVPVVGYTQIITEADDETDSPIGLGDIAVAAPYLSGVFDPSGPSGTKQGIWSLDFSHGWLHVLWALTVTAGTPSFSGAVFGRARQAKPGTTPGSNSPTYIEGGLGWFEVTQNGISGGTLISAANFPRCISDDGLTLVYAESYLVNGCGRQYYPQVVGTPGGTNPSLNVYMAFSRG